MGNSCNSGIPETQTIPYCSPGNENFPGISHPWFPLEHPWWKGCHHQGDLAMMGNWAHIWHSLCLDPHPELHGPWHCSRCETQLKAKRVCNLTLDCNLLRYLNGAPVIPKETLEHCIWAVCFFWLSDDGTLHVQGWEESDLQLPPF